MNTIVNSRIVDRFANVYDIQLIDMEGDPTDPTIDVATSTASVDWKGNSEDVDFTLMTSKAAVTYVITAPAEFVPFKALVSAKEEQIQIRIDKNGSLFWVGFVLVDLLKRQLGFFPFSLTLSATDGLARLKEYTYEQGNLSDRDPAIAHLIHILDKVPLKHYYGANDVYLETNATLWPEGLLPSDTYGQLDQIRLGLRALRTVDEKGDITYLKYSEVLAEILKCLGLRMVFCRGRYRLLDVFDFARQTGAVRFRQYTVSGGISGVRNLFSWNFQTVQIQGTVSGQAKPLQGATATYLAPLRGVDAQYAHYSRQNLAPEFQDLDLAQGSPTATVLDFGTDQGAGFLSLTASFRYRMTPQTSSTGSISARYYLLVEAHLRIVDPDDATEGVSLFRPGTPGRTRVNYDDAEWDTTTPTKKIQFYLPLSHYSAHQNFQEATVTLQTPTVPEGGNLLFSLQVKGAVDEGNNLTGDPVFARANRIFLESVIAGSIEDQYSYTYFNPRGTGEGQNSVILPREYLLGDGPGDNTLGRLEYRDQDPGAFDPEWVRTNGWKRKSPDGDITTTVNPLTGVLSSSILALQDESIERIDATFEGPAISPDFLINWEDSVYAMFSGKLVLNSGRWSGRWTEVGYNYVERPDPGVPATGPLPTVNTGPGSGAVIAPGDVGLDGSGGDDIITPTPPGVIPPDPTTTLGFLTLPAGPGVDITTLNVGDVTGMPLFPGDGITLLHPVTGLPIPVTVNLPSGLVPGVQGAPGAIPQYGATGVTWVTPTTSLLSIEPITLPGVIPAGSRIQVNSRSRTQGVASLRTAHEVAECFTQDQPLTVGFCDWFWRVGPRLGWKVSKVHFAVKSNPDNVVWKSNLKYYDNSDNLRYTYATHNSSALGSSRELIATLTPGYFLVEVESLGQGAPPRGLRVTLELTKYTT